MRQIFLDLETTGLEPATNRVVEVAAHAFLDKRPMEGGEFHHYCNPQQDIEAGAQRVHGLSLEFLQDYPPFETIAEELRDFLQGSEVIIHNASFDVGFLNAGFARCEIPPLEEVVAKITCTLEMARRKFSGGHSLKDLCRRFGVNDSARVQHSASLDTRLLAQVYFAMMREQMSMDISYKQEAQADIAAQPVQQLLASAAENAAHEKFLQEMEDGSGIKPLWRQLTPES